MPYRRGRSYRSAARLYRSSEKQPPRARPALLITLLAAALVAGMAIVIAPHVKTVLTASTDTATPARPCAHPAPATSAAPAASAMSASPASPLAVGATPAAASATPATADSGASSAPAGGGAAGSAAATPTSSAAPTVTAPEATETTPASDETAPVPAETGSPDASATAADPDASATAPAPAGSTAPTPCPSPSGSPAATAPTVAGIPPINPPGRRGLAGANAVDAAGNAFSFNQTPAQAADSTNCTVSVPAHPLSAKGLATPWVLGDGCTWENGDTEGVFVDATILSPDGQLQVYNPLVITQGTQPEVAPTPPTIARGSQVILSVGFNGNAVALVGRGARQGKCIDAFGNSLINQTPQCNAANFYRMADAEIRRGILTVPAIGIGKDGQPCPTVRDFSLIDQDQSDNAVASYLFNPNTGQTAQATAANQASLPGDTTESNGSDNGLLDKFVDPALGCTPFTAPNPTNPNGASASQALNELSARQNQRGMIALLPVNDPQLLVNGKFSIGKTNTFRMETDQRLLPFNTNTTRNAAKYCQDMVNIATPRLKLDADLEVGGASPVPDLGNNLANFMAARLSASFENLNCKNYGLTNPVTLTLDGSGVATGATFNTTPQTAKIAGGRGGRHN